MNLGYNLYSYKNWKERKLFLFKDFYSGITKGVYMANKGKVKLICSVCLNRNYSLNKSSSMQKLELKKYCPHCGKHTLHKETR